MVVDIPVLALEIRDFVLFNIKQ